ncbi:hypothetical protein SAMN05660464_2526 [Geodermatophilus dictyosporus]|uniref:Uncharacterized protein n=1 Tax=Geodermatophilus dictyosporus TaxID=1523247 RepID=A0A1I5NI69_9ACTN|nr:hypothetical protein [Geodermatophilus dictyosporus]SFP21417.1 hypothetical protein SAMN05660464_2526 [Geodermatophilus dictyosporus]
MVVLLAELLVLLLLAGLLLHGLGVWSAGSAVPADVRPSGRRRQRSGAVRARWVAAHDEVDGQTRVLLRRCHLGPDGLPVVLEDRVYTAFASDDPAWEARFTEAMSAARFRCSYLDAEESAG